MAEVDIATLGIKVDASSADDGAAKLENLSRTAERTTKSTQSTTSATTAMQASIRAAIAAINANTSAMGLYNDQLNKNRNASSGAAAACDDMESRVSRLRASLDPLEMAIERVNQELVEARVLFEAGAMSAADYARAQVILNARSADFARRQGVANAAMGMGARSAKLQAHEMLNLSRQFADIGVTAAMGMNPLMILVQQGPQIGDVLQTARARGISAASAFKQMGASIMPWITRLAGPLAAVGAGMATLGLAARGASLGLGDVQKEFGFTETQMERLEEKGVDLGYTMGDVMHGIAGAIAEAFNLDDVANAWNNALDYLAKDADDFIKDVIYIFGYGVGVIKSAASDIPASLAAAFQFAVIEILKFINDAIDKSVKVINNFRKFAGFEGGDWKPFQFEVPGMSAGAQAQFDKMKTAGDASGRKAVGAYVSTRGSAREDRIRDEAGKGDAARKAKASEEEKAWDKALKSAEAYLKALQTSTAEIGKNIFEVKRMATEREAAELNAAAAALGTGAAMEKAASLTQQMAKATEDWIKATNAQKIKEMERALGDENEQLKFEATLVGMSNEEKAKAIKLREIAIKVLEAERQGYVGVAEALRDETAAALEAAAAKGKREDDVEAAHRAADAARDVADGVREATESFGELFGTVGEGFSNVINTIFEFTAAQEESKAKLADLQKEYDEGLKSQTAYEFEKGRIQEEMAQAQIANYANMLGAAKTFFKEGSAGYKVLETAERAFRLFQFAMAIKAMLIDKTQTASSVANSGIRAAADGVAAVAKAIASLPFPLNIAAGAATLAFLVAIGVKMFGGGGKGASKSASSAASKTMGGKDIYSGPRDEYGAPTSGYSVLRPGQTTVAGNDNTMYGGAGNIYQGDTNITVQGNMVQDTMTELVPVLEAHKAATIQETRQVVAQDAAARSTRQRIGGG